MIRFLTEIEGQVFQFEDAQELRLTVEGSCNEFWMLAESDCMTINRTEMTR